MVDLSDIRREYTKGGLRRADLPADPMELFEKWLGQARESGISDPTAMSLATVDETGQPFQRIVLLKAFDAKGLVFFTNLESRKAGHIKNNGKVSLLFPWYPIERQIAVTGEAKALSTAQVVKYFVSRPKDSQIAAWVSKQSSKLSGRQMLESKFNEMKAKFAKGEVPIPKFWGGYRITPVSMEFWQGGDRRLHDRFLYQKQQESGQAQWQIDRLAP